MLDGLKPYSEYKDGSEPRLWDALPSHWTVNRLRHVAELLVSNVDKHTHDGEVPVRLCNYVDVYKNRRITNRLAFMRATATPEEVHRFRIRIGDVLITKDSEAWNDIGVPALVEHEAPDLLCGYHLAILRPRADRLIGGYMLYALLAHTIAAQFHIEANGVTRYGLSHGAIKDILLPLPPPAEQAGIVRFLGAVDRKVNRFIRAKRRLIEVLTEQKQAIITHAVTKGLNPHAPLKPSGIDWLGDVPEHWEVLRLRNLVSQVTSGSRGWSRYMADTGPLFIRIGNLTRGSLELDMSDAARLQLPKDASEVHRTRAQSNDILVSITAYIGSFAVVPEGIEEAYVSQHVALCRPRPTVHNARWIGYVLLSPIGQAHGKFSLNGGTKDGLSLDDVKNHPVLMPPPDEQDRIVAWIESESAQLNASIAAIKREIDLIREYRTRLVADVVTGKVDVRAAAASLPDEAADALTDPGAAGAQDGADDPAGEDDQADAGADLEPALDGAGTDGEDEP